ncbi:MAG: MBL fold metallo-hydrolase, partial [Pseudoalteromonas sp.]|nr:MBL fold metallo-hydrolase [Pseudoalteromonas sp.]
MNIQQFRYNADNLGYLVYSSGQGAAIDAGAVGEVIEFAKQNHIQIKYVTNTHTHHDHTSGNSGLL